MSNLVYYKFNKYFDSVNLKNQFIVEEDSSFIFPKRKKNLNWVPFDCVVNG